MENIISSTAKVFKDVRIVNSNIHDFCSIGDDSDLVDVEMLSKSEFGRRNLIRNSTIGVGSYTGTNTIIKNSVIGNYCSIGWNVSIGGGNHPMDNVSMYTDYWYKRTFGMKTAVDPEVKQVFIGSDVWIGSGATLLAGITVGDGAVIGAGSVVTNNVMPYEVVVGVPARTIKYRFSKDIVDLLCQIKWWNWEEERIIQNISILTNTPTLDELQRILENEK